MALPSVVVSLLQLEYDQEKQHVTVNRNKILLVCYNNRTMKIVGDLFAEHHVDWTNLAICDFLIWNKTIQKKPKNLLILPTLNQFNSFYSQCNPNSWSISTLDEIIELEEGQKHKNGAK